MVVKQLRDLEVPVRVVRGVYGSRKYANALRGWMIFIPQRKYDYFAQKVIDEIEIEDA